MPGDELSLGWWWWLRTEASGWAVTLVSPLGWNATSLCPGKRLQHTYLFSSLLPHQPRTLLGRTDSQVGLKVLWGGSWGEK